MSIFIPISFFLKTRRPLAGKTIAQNPRAGDGWHPAVDSPPEAAKDSFCVSCARHVTAQAGSHLFLRIHRPALEAAGQFKHRGIFGGRSRRSRGWGWRGCVGLSRRRGRIRRGTRWRGIEKPGSGLLLKPQPHFFLRADFRH
jgi:hypothetical protein